MYRYFMNYLDARASDPRRVPLLLRGARQIGKSHTLREYGSRLGRRVVEVNFELRPELEQCFRSRQPDEILRQLEAVTGLTIEDRSTVLFIDEIQESNDALMALRAFKELRPQLDVVAAGSLIDFALNDGRLNSFPVGRIAFAWMHPMSFQEFLMALGEDKIAESCALSTVDKPPAPAIHSKMLSLVRLYYMLGGMPEVISTYLETKSILAASRIQTRLGLGFSADFAKYGARYDHRKLQKILASAPRRVGMQFKFSYVDRDSKARDLKAPLADLERAGLIRRIPAVSGNGLPLAAEERDGIFKIQMLDIGLMLNTLGLSISTMPLESALFINEGALAEQFVGQELLAYADPLQPPQIYYWSREAKGAEAEVDFVIAHGGRPVPVEVKAGATGSLRSLRQFMLDKKCSVGVRFSQHPLSLVDGILSIPLYMVSSLSRLLDSHV